MTRRERRPADAEPAPTTTPTVDTSQTSRVARNGHIVARTVFATPRAAEFLETRALQTQTGQPESAFGDVVVKELLDNAIDAAESAGAEPVIEISNRAADGSAFVTVTDNGDGIAPATVAAVCDFTMLVSDKAKYRGPARGAQGNALKTLLGIPFALEVDAPVVIESHGVRHELQVQTDLCGDVVVEHGTSPCARTVGTSVTVPLPEHLDVDVTGWAFHAALVNPHATITAIDSGYSDDAPPTTFYKSVGAGWSKWAPSKPSSPHWYDTAAFAALVGAHIRAIRRTGVDVALGGFIAEFDGLSGSPKQKQIRAATPGVTHLSQLEGRPDLIAALHDAMLQHAKPTPASRLGPVGADHYRHLLDDAYGVHGFWYKTGHVTVDGIPWVIEVAVANTAQPGRNWYACNHSPSFGDPFARTSFRAAGLFAIGSSSFVADSDMVATFDTAAIVHVICAAPEFMDKGKVALVAPKPVVEVVGKALDSATKVLRREAEQARKDAARAERATARRIDTADRAAREQRWSLKDAVFEVLPEAKAAAGHICAARTLMYKVRPRIQQFTDKELRPEYFTQTLLPEYERTVAGLNGLYYEPRGALHHPHDDEVIRLGTREVEAYELPEWQFDKILYIEKEGLEAQLAPYRLGRRYDMAIIYGNGYSPTACRNLLARSEVRELKLFVLHDADIGGYNIARTLGEATKRMPDHDIVVIDLGLAVPQAIELGFGDRVVHPPQRATSRSGPRRGGVGMVHRHTDLGRVRQDASPVHALRVERVRRGRAGRVHRGRARTSRRYREAGASRGGALRAGGCGPRRAARRTCFG